MLEPKDAVGFFSAFRGLVRHIVTLAIPGETASYGPGALYDRARAAGLEATPAEDIEDAILQVAAMARLDEGNPRILICGSLHLAGRVLTENY
jgi:dihydrofolate synthase / folylpolyglutamate synthase